MKDQEEFTYKSFIDMFFPLAMSLLSGIVEPRISEEIKIIMQLTDQARIGDWYLYQNYTNLRIYGCELAPYKLPNLLPMGIFALEYIGKMINADEVHFVAAKKQSQFRMKSQIGPFICNSRASGEEDDKKLK